MSIHLSLHLRSEGAAVMSRWDEKKTSICMAIWCCAHGTIEGKIDCVQSFPLETISLMQTCVTNAHCHRQLKVPSVSKPWLNVRQDRKGGKNWESEKEKEAPHSGFQLKPLLITDMGSSA